MRARKPTDSLLWILATAIFTAATLPAAAAADPPPVLNYQGVLRNAADAPLSGSYDMTLRLFSAATGGDEIIVDQHIDQYSGAVPVTGGLFNIGIGAGVVNDGSGPGVYSTLADVFRAYRDVWLEVQVGNELLSPRTKVAASGFALNAGSLSGRPASEFLDTSATAQVKSGSLKLSATDFGMTTLDVTGYFAGAFRSNASTGSAELGRYGVGIVARGEYAGSFSSVNGLNTAYLATASRGLEVYGNQEAGYFTTSSSTASLASGNTGVYARGTDLGGSFGDLNSSGVAYAATGDIGLYATGNDHGGEFADSNSSGRAYLGWGDRGIWAKGLFAGGTFSHPNDVTFWADVSTPVYKIAGTGAVSFVQNHPYEKDKTIVYAAPEGDEVAVYTRGTGRLVDGVARVPLGETFALVANPDLGLTAHLTARSALVPLQAERVTTSELVVRGPAGSDATFDYLVYGLRIGFEEKAIVVPKTRPAFLPDAAAIAAEYGGQDALRARNARSRFESMRAAAGQKAPLDTTRSRALAAAIDQDRDAILDAARERADARVAADAPSKISAGGAPQHVVAPVEPAARERTTTAAPPAAAVAVASEAGTWMHVSEPVEEGDLLVFDPLRPDELRRATAAGDPGIVGVAAAASRTSGEGRLEVLLAEGRYVLVHADASTGAIAPGDALVSSPTPGHAMRAAAPAPGAIVGKAMEALPAGRGLIRVLVFAR